MATLTISQTINYSRLALSPGIDLIRFINGIQVPATATFTATQFDGSPILTSVEIQGSTGFNHLVVNGVSLDASNWTFVSWSTSDSITINGTSGNNTLTGSRQRDTINGQDGGDTITGGSGRDVMNGGAGKDTFVYTSELHLVSGELVDGGTGGSDRILLAGGITYDFRNMATISNIEALQFDAVAQASFAGSSFGAGAITSVTGHADLDWLRISGPAINLTGVSFTSWTDGSDILQLSGTGGVANTITGSNQAETISGGSLADVLSGRGGNDSLSGFGGADTLIGGAGNDTFNYASGSDIAAGESVNGGSGLDTIQLTSNTGSYQLGLVSIANVEALKFSNLGSTVILNGDQIGTTTINSVTGAGNVDFLQVMGSADISVVVFQSWSSNDTILLLGGFATDDTITGSEMIDTIQGNGGNDVVRGGAGGDTLSGGGGEDIVSYAGSSFDVTINLATESVSGGGDAAGDTIDGFEGATGGEGNDTLTGDDGANVLSGGAGDDSIFGGLGADTLSGGSGNDTFTYAVEEELDGIETINGGAGTLDTIVIGGAVADDLDFTSAIVSGIERLVFQIDSSVHFQGSVFGTGAGQINSVTGSADDITLFLTGADTDLTGVTFTNWQSPLFYGVNGDNIVIAGSGADDVLTGSSQSDVLYAILGSDTLSGGGGSDYLMGSLGQDFMTGGADADIFFFEYSQ